MIKCLVCDSEFLKKRSHHKYCSPNCGKIASYRLNNGFQLRLVELVCAVCGKKFLQKRANHTEYCTQPCKKLGVFRKFKGLPVFGPKKHTRGTGYITRQGYRLISRSHPNAKARSLKSGKGQIMEHIWVMSNHLGRPLRKHESVHHKNGIRDDNRIENLELWLTAHPPGQRVEDKLNWCKELLERYGNTVIMKNNLQEAL